MIPALIIAILAAGSLRPASNVQVDQVLVQKKEHTLTLLSHGKAIQTYKVALGGSPIGAKERQGDHKTPEGHYILDRRNPHSQYYKSIHILYPNEQDRKKAKARGMSPGGDIMIHGLTNGYGRVGAMHRLHDWTDGCIAVTNEEMDEIWRVVRDGTPIEIRP